MAVTITETHSDSAAIASLLVSNTGGSAVTITVTRSSGVGGEVNLRGMTDKLVAAGAGVAGYDLEPPIGVSYTYKVYDDAGTLLATTSAVLLDGPWTADDFSASAWLRHLYDSRLSVPVLISGFPDIVRPITQDSFLPLGAKYPVISSQIRQARTGSVTLVTLTEESRAAIHALLADGSPVQLATMPRFNVEDGGLYCSVGDTTESRVTDENGDEIARTITLPLTEIAAPPTSAGIHAAYTWTDVLADEADWTTLMADVATWADLVARLV